MINSWSHSKLTDFDKCKRMFWLKHDQKIPEPPRTLKPGQTEFANDRGTRIHDNCEGYVRGDHDALCPEADKHFGIQLDLMRVLYAEGLVSLEGEWGMSKEWEPCGWNGDWMPIDPAAMSTAMKTAAKKSSKMPERGKDGDIIQVGKEYFVWVPAWLRLKLDAMVMIDKTHAIVIDYKSGRKYGNEVKHAEQLQLYQLVTFLRYPFLEKVTAELWYIDQNEVTSFTYTRSQGLRFRDGFNRRGIAALSAIAFPPASTVFSCRWCPYLNTEHCEDGVSP